MKRGQRPSRHDRKVRCGKGRRFVRRRTINPEIRKIFIKRRKRRREIDPLYGKYWEDPRFMTGGAFDSAKMRDFREQEIAANLSIPGEHPVYGRGKIGGRPDIGRAAGYTPKSMSKAKKESISYYESLLSDPDPFIRERAVIDLKSLGVDV